MLNDIDRQRIKTIDDFQTIAAALSNDILEKVETRGYDLIDHFFFRLLQLVLLAGFLLLVVIIMFKKIMAR